MGFKRVLMHLRKQIRRTIRCMSRETKKLLIVALIATMIGGFLGGRIGGLLERNKAEKELLKVTAQLQKKEEARVSALQGKSDQTSSEEKVGMSWNLVLVNNKNPMEKGYVPELTKLKSDYYVDSRIAEAANQMLKDAKAAGMRIEICSAYRSVERQEQVFNESLEERLKKGMDYWEAFSDNRLSVAEPGTSEHALGLALDLISNQYTELDEGQENTKEAKWLKENCYKYGFILRYPPEKTDITGIIYEPWHYRYVGVEDATEIMKLGITLEEYLETYYKK